MKTISLFAALLLLPSLVMAGPTPPLAGKYSLQGGSAQTDGHLRITGSGSDPLKRHIDIWMTERSSAQPIHSYVVEMTKKLHVVVVSSDFSSFQHIHPVLGANGHFTIDQQFPAPGLYYLYADGLPNDYDHQVFRFDLHIGNSSGQKPLDLAPTGREVNVGPYTVDISQAKLTAGGMDMIAVHISQGDKPAADLHPYLGAAAHAVFLNSRDLSYIHVHPMSVGQMQMQYDNRGRMIMPPDLPENSISPADMMLHVTIKEPGLYKLWLQFRGGGQLYVAPFVLTAQ